MTLGRAVTILVILAAAALSFLSARSGKEGVFGTVFSYVLLAWAGLGAAWMGPAWLVQACRAR